MKAILKIYSDVEETKTLYFDSKKQATIYGRRFLNEIHVAEKVKNGIKTRVLPLKGNCKDLCTNP